MFTVTLPTGVSVTCDSSAEVRDLLSELDLLASRPTPAFDMPMFAEVRPAFKPRTGAFLRLLQDARPGYVTPSMAQDALKAKSTKGIGPIINGIKNELAGLGFEPSDAIETHTTMGGTRWGAGPKLDDVLAKGGLGR